MSDPCLEGGAPGAQAGRLGLGSGGVVDPGQELFAFDEIGGAAIHPPGGVPRVIMRALPDQLAPALACMSEALAKAGKLAPLCDPGGGGSALTGPPRGGFAG